MRSSVDETPNSEGTLNTDSLSNSVNLANEALKISSTYFKSRNSGDNERYSHLERIALLKHILTISDKEMTTAMIKLGHDERHALAIPAIYMDSRGGVLVDAVVTREGAEIKPIIALHEFIHRAAKHRGLACLQTDMHEQMYEILDFPKAKREELKTTIPNEEYQQKLREIKGIIRVFNEGITQWATLYLANMTPQFNPPVTDTAYVDEVNAVDEVFHDTLSYYGLPNEQIEELMLDLALTGDFSRLKATLPPVSKDLKDVMGDDYNVSLLINSIDTTFLMNRYKQILGNQ